MNKSTISNWVRQARHRAKKNDIYNDLNMEDVDAIISHHNGQCAYCETQADTLDHPFPLKDNAPNVASNVLPSCKGCKSVKKTNDLVWLFRQEHISQDKYVKLIEDMLSRNGSDILKTHIKKVTGIDHE